jgi:glutamine cyclotransferase
VVNAWPHDPTAFTQGLIYLKGILFETTGLYGKSSLRKVDLETGKVRQIQAIPADIFGEGMTLLNDQVFVITWQSHKAFVYDPQSFTVQKEFTYEGEGWGLTHDGHSLIMSDGTDVIRFRDPATFEVTRSISVTSNGRPVKMLNELEYIKGEIYANVWQTNFVVRIDPASGRVTSVIDFSGLLAPQEYARNTDVLNGIAYDANGDRLFVTGKNWPKLFEVQIKSK